jgi:hypothetical protein
MFPQRDPLYKLEASCALQVMLSVSWSDFKADTRTAKEVHPIRSKKGVRTNSDQIADFLSKANPKSWPQAEMRKMMRDHLTLTTEEVVARLQGNWAADIAAFDKVHEQILHMADMLTEGIIKQHSAKFK